MPDFAIKLPACRGDLVIRPIGDGGRYVVKDRQSGQFFQIGDEEHFLFEQLDGKRDAAQVCAAFERKFGEPLSREELNGFLETAAKQGLVESPEHAARNEPLAPRRGRPIASAKAPRARQSILYWRKRLFDPDRFFTWLEPRIRFFWTRAFLVFSAGCILLAAFVLWANRFELSASFTSALRWETALWVWLTLLAVTTLHEFAHGLTCKHYGGEVREIGFLLMYFMPCFYCNVSDAWLLREKSKRLWVTFAGGYFELFLWALAVFLWRITVPDSLINYLAFVVLASCGIQSFFNFNPLLKLDGYYLLSDWVEIPNLRSLALARLKAWLGSLLWGGPPPEHAKRGRFLVGFGLASWVYSATFLGLMLLALARYLGDRWGSFGIGGVALLAGVATRGLFQGISGGEVKKMILERHKRTAGWLLTLGSVAGVLFGVEMDDRASGPFEVRSAARAELRAPVAAFVEEVYFDEGEWASPGAPVVRLAIPDLESRLTQKGAEISQAEARLRLLEIGPRPEEIAHQRQRVERAVAWRDLARRDLDRQRHALEQELARLEQKIGACRAELEAAQDAYHRAGVLRGERALSDEEFAEAERRYRVSQAELEQVRAEKAAQEAIGTLADEAEQARREKDLAAEQAALTLLEAGSRPEEIAAQRATLARLEEEASYLQQLQQKLLVYSPVPGVITTPRLREKMGRFLQEGEPICLVEEPASLEAEIALSEQQAERVRVGQRVRLKARALPFETFQSRVERIAPVAEQKSVAPAQTASPVVQKTVTVYCRLENDAAPLRPGMTGYARIHTTRRRCACVVLDRLLCFIRTEFWW